MNADEGRIGVMHSSVAPRWIWIALASLAAYLKSQHFTYLWLSQDDLNYYQTFLDEDG